MKFERKNMTFDEYIKKIKEYINNKPKTWEECSDVYLVLECNAPELDYEENKIKVKFLSDVNDICEMVEPFSMCEKEDKLLLEIMKKYGYLEESNEEIARKEMLEIVKKYILKDDKLMNSNEDKKSLKRRKLFAEMEEKFEGIREKHGVNTVLYMRDARDVRDELIKQGLLK